MSRSGKPSKTLAFSTTFLLEGIATLDKTPIDFRPFSKKKAFTSIARCFGEGTG
jgi:hypothetical protein